MNPKSTRRRYDFDFDEMENHYYEHLNYFNYECLLCAYENKKFTLSRLDDDVAVKHLADVHKIINPPNFADCYKENKPKLTKLVDSIQWGIEEFFKHFKTP